MIKKNNPEYPKVESILNEIGETAKSQPILDKLHKTVDASGNSSQDLSETLTDEQKRKLKKYDDLKVDNLPEDWEKQLTEKNSLEQRLDFAKKFITILGK